MDWIGKRIEAAVATLISPPVALVRTAANADAVRCSQAGFDRGPHSDDAV
jgi:hypothetical protein